MTHDPLFAAALATDTRLLRTAIIYDFIPYRRPDFYLPGATQSLEYAVALRWLGAIVPVPVEIGEAGAIG